MNILDVGNAVVVVEIECQHIGQLPLHDARCLLERHGGAGQDEGTARCLHQPLEAPTHQAGCDEMHVDG